MLILIPIKLLSESNLKEHWAKRSARHKKHKLAIKSAFIGQKNSLPCEVTLTRISPRKLDDDNLQGSLKHVRDIVADWLIPGLAPGRADGDPRITWKYAQEKGKPGEYGLKIEVKYENGSEVDNGQ